MGRRTLPLLFLPILVVAPAVAQSRFVAPRVFAQGADAQTTAAFELLLLQELRRAAQDRLVDDGTAIVACADPECAARQARRSKVDAALLCTLTRLGAEHVAVLACVDAQGKIVWSHRLTAARPEHLDPIAVRFADAAASGRLPKAARAERARNPRGRGRDGPRGDPRRPAVVGDEAATTAAAATPEPRRSTSTQGPRFGTVHPSGGSYAGVPRLMSFAWVWRHQTPSFAVEAVPVLGVAWGGEFAADGGQARDWSILDLFVTWAPVPADIAPVVGAGIGLHGLRLQRDTAGGRKSDNTIGVSLAVGGGLVMFRTYDFQVALDARYHVFLDRFSGVDGKGAHGFSLMFGLQRR